MIQPLHLKNSRLSRRLLFYVIISFLLLTIAATLLHMVISYRRIMNSIDEVALYIEDSYIDGIATSVFTMDEEQLLLQLKGIVNLSQIEYVEVREKRGDKWYRAGEGNPEAARDIVHRFQLEYQHPKGERYACGLLTVSSSLAKVYSEMWAEGLTALTTYTFVIGLLALCFFMIFQFSLTRHLISISQHTDRLDFNKLDQKLTLNRSASKLWPNDELDGLILAFNRMKERLTQDLINRKQAEESLANSEARFKAIYENSPIAISLVGIDGVPILSNPAFIDMMGYSEPEIKAMDFSEFTYPEDLEREYPLFQEVLRGERDAYQIEKRNFHKDGHLIWVNVYIVALRDDEGQVRHLIAMGEDITARKQSEEALQMSEARYRDLVDSQTELIGRYTLDWKVTFVNEAYCQYYNKQLEELIGISFMERIPEEDRENVVEEHHKLLSSDLKQVVHEHRAYDANGELKWHQWINRAIFDESGRFKEFQSVGRDITDRKEKEIELNRAYEEIKLFRNMVEMSTQGIGTAYLDKSVHYQNPALLNLLGIHNREDAQSYDYEEFYTPEDLDYLRDRVIPAVMAEGSWSGELPIRSLDGRVIPTIQNIYLIRDDKGMPIALSNVVQDISDRKKIEKELMAYRDHLEELVEERTSKLENEIEIRKQAEKQIAESLAEMEAFNYSVSHDLRSPLRGIDGYAHLLEDAYSDCLDEQGISYLSRIRQSTQRMDQLIEDLLKYSHLDQMDSRYQETNLDKVVEKILNHNFQTLEETKIDIDISLEVKRIIAEPEGLSLAVDNLLQNAIKFTRDEQKPKISIRSYEKDGDWIIEIEDNGIGFEMKYHDRIFNIFQRLEREEDYPGTGVGLAIVKKVMERMEGRVWAESEKGIGTTFHLAFPQKH